VTLQQHQAEFAGSVISSPAVALGKPVDSATLAVLSVVSKNLPKLQVEKLNIDTLVDYLPIKDLYQNDPLVAHCGLPARLTYELLSKIAVVCKDVAPKISLPYLLIHGPGDGICPIAGSEEFHKNTQSKEKKFEKLKGGHETLNESSGEAVTMVVNWLKSRL
jgi:acylglycerol lipase